MASSWYTDVNTSSLEQGDIIEDCKILIPDETAYNSLMVSNGADIPTTMNFLQINCIVLSQSCDLMNDKITSVIVCPINSLTERIQKNECFKNPSWREQLRQGNQPPYHLLDKMTIGTKEDYYCVDFHNIFSVPKSYLLKCIENKTRKRVISPYKEHLAQSFARYFMRVGLPSSISKEEIETYHSS